LDLRNNPNPADPPITDPKVAARRTLAAFRYVVVGFASIEGLFLDLLELGGGGVIASSRHGAAVHLIQATSITSWLKTLDCNVSVAELPPRNLLNELAVFDSHLRN
jgi:hypothetical protein